MSQTYIFGTPIKNNPLQRSSEKFYPSESLPPETMNRIAPLL